MNLILYGTSYKTAPVEIREKASFTDDEIASLLPKLKETQNLYEAAILSTCNRTELYAVCNNNSDIAGVIGKLDKFDGMPARYFYHRDGFDAATHLFRVAASLEAQMVGETQIQSQVRQAYLLARDAKSLGPHLNKLFHTAIAVGKEVRAKTSLGAGAVSISGAAVELAGHIYERLNSKSALLIGAGETGELVAKHLLDRGVASLKIANRTKSKSAELAAKYNAVSIDFEAMPHEFLSADIIISATSSKDYVITDDMIRPHIVNTQKKLIIIDIAIPRDIDPAIARHENIFLYDMDDLNVVVKKNVERRKNEIPEAERIVAHFVGRFAKWLNGRKRQ